MKFEAKFVKQYCPNLFSWKEYSDVINTPRLVTLQNFMCPHGENTYTWEKYTWCRSFESEYVPASIIKKLLDDKICFLVDASKVTKKINDFAHQLEKEYELPCDAHIFSCRNTSQPHPFGKHRDDSHNVIVQCEGETNFKVWDLDDNLIHDVIMEPGDAIFIPAQYDHQANSLTTRLSVSFPLAFDPTPVFQEREWIEL